MKSSGRLLQPLIVRVLGWGTLRELPAATQLRDIRKARGVWVFRAKGNDETWTSCMTRHDLRAALGMEPRRGKGRV